MSIYVVDASLEEQRRCSFGRTRRVPRQIWLLTFAAMAIEVLLSPRALRDGDTLKVHVEGAEDLAGQTASVVLVRTDDIETGWVASLGVEIGANGVADAEWANVGLGRESAVFAVAIEVAGQRQAVDSSEVSVVNPAAAVTTLEEAHARRTALVRDQEGRYARGLGDPSATGSIEHRVLCAVERLLVTTPMRLAGVEVLPVAHRPRGEEQRAMIDALLAHVGWPTRIDPQAWRDRVEPSRPWTAIICAPVWATSLEEAAALAWSSRDELIAVLGLNRGARGRSVATVVEQRQPDDSIRHRVYVEDARYGGNLLGGFASGEDQAGLLVQQAAMHSDALLRLCVDLYSEALADPSPDARYLRLWSLLETLSGARLQKGQAVQRVDGTAWPDQPGTTSAAAPRVYRLIADHVQARSVDEASFVSPARDLYEAVRAWYARRNATGHYGRFVVGDPRQAAQGWYARAQQTAAAAGAPDTWLMTFQQATASVLQWELMTVGGQGLP